MCRHLQGQAAILLQCLTLKMKKLRPFRTSATIHSAIPRNFPGEWCPLQRHYEILKQTDLQCRLPVSHAHFIEAILVMLLQEEQLGSLQSLQLCSLVSLKGTAPLNLLVSDFLAYVICYVFRLLTDLRQETHSHAFMANFL
jgi:hypothetical protein